MKQLILLLFISLFSSQLLAAQRDYQADVEGMVCAFCAYSVSRDMAGLPGVDADSVNIDLERGTVSFSSARPVSSEMLTAVFADTAFRVSGLREVEQGRAAQDENYELVLELTINDTDPAAFESVLESVGVLAAENPSRMVLTAPEVVEEQLLKPLLMGRRQVMKVQFIPSEHEAIQLQLYLATIGQ